MVSTSLTKLRRLPGFLAFSLSASLLLGVAGSATLLSPALALAEEPAAEAAADTATKPMCCPEWASVLAKWEDRGNMATVDQLITELEGLYTSKGKCACAAGMLSQALYWKADNLGGGEKLAEQKDLFHKGYKWGLKSLESNVGFRKTMDRSPSDLRNALAYLGEDSAESLLWTTMNLNALVRIQRYDDRYQALPEGKSCGANKRKPHALDFVYHKRLGLCIERLLEIASDKFHGMPHSLAGSYYASLHVLAGGDLDSAGDHFAKAFAVGPDLFFNYNLYARDYLTLRKERHQAVAALEFVANTQPTELLPELTPEQTLEQGKARHMLQHLDSFLPVTISRGAPLQ